MFRKGRCGMQTVILAVSFLLTAVVGAEERETVKPESRLHRELSEVEKQRANVKAGEISRDNEGLPACSQFTSCAECVFDATLGLMTEYANCTWCPSEKKCVETSEKPDELCSNPQYQGGPMQPQCREMQCVAAKDWTNIYFCRPWSRAVLGLSFILLLISAFFYFFWMSAVRQMPWRYPKLHSVVDRHLDNSFLAELRTDEAEVPAAAGDDDDDETSLQYITCQISKVRSPTFNGDAVCAWSNIARLSFMPLIIGLVVSLFNIFLIFFVGLKPWFADWYFFWMLVVGYGAYAVFFAVVMRYREPIVGDPEKRLSTFFHLAVALRGRKLLDVFPQLEEPATVDIPLVKVSSPQERPEANSNAPTQSTTEHQLSSQGQSLNNAHFGENLTSLAIPNKSFSSPGVTLEPMRQHSAINDYAKGVIDENVEPVLWQFEPDRLDIIADNFWLLHFFSSLAFVGFWLLTLNTVDQSWTLWKVVSSTWLIAVGLLLLVFGSFFTAHIYSSTVRLYVMTKKNLYVFSQNGSGAVHYHTPLEAVRCASVQTYACFGITRWARVIQTFSWTAPEEGRKMPSIATKEFVGLPVDVLMELRERFTKAISINIDSDAIKKDFSHLRTAWKVHISSLTLVLMLLPIGLYQSYMMPSSSATIGLIALSSLPLCFIYRGWRMHKRTVVGHNVAKENLFWTQSQRALKKRTLKGVTSGLIAKNRLNSLLKAKPQKEEGEVSTVPPEREGTASPKRDESTE